MSHNPTLFDCMDLPGSLKPYVVGPTVHDEIVLQIPTAKVEEILTDLKAAIPSDFTFNLKIDSEYPEDPFARYVETEPTKPGPVVVRRKREGIQLCKVYDPEKPPKGWTWVYFEPKEDGYRCPAHIKNGKAELLTSTGLPHHNVRFIQAQLEAAAAAYESCDDIVLDGEIVHLTLDFNTAGGLLRLHEDDPQAEGFIYKVWDVLPKAEFDAKTCRDPLSSRKVNLKHIVTLIRNVNGPDCKILENPYEEGTLENIVDYARLQVIEKGKEGIVVKRADGLYEYRKSGVWLKWKPEFTGDFIADMKDGDFKIEGAYEGRGKCAGTLGGLIVSGYLCDDGNIAPDRDASSELGGQFINSEAGTGFDNKERIALWAEFHAGTLVGKIVEIKHKGVTEKNSLKFPVFHRMRPDKE